MGKKFTGWGCFGIVVYFIVLVVVGAIVGGLVLRQLWAWFMVPTFAVSALTIPQAMGLQLVVGLFLQGLKREKHEWGEGATKLLLGATFSIVLNAMIFLVFGWIVQSFM